MEGIPLGEFDQNPEATLSPPEDPVNSTEDPTTEKLLGPCSASDLPPLLYRWSNVESQGTNSPELFEAGLFQNRPEMYFHPSDILEQSFLDHFRNHVTKAKVKTPFISTFTHPLAPIHRAVHRQKGAIVSVIDPSKVDTPIFKANKLVPTTNTATYSWRGDGEFEIWGRVPAAAIVCTFPIAKLEAICVQKIEDFLQLSLIRARKRCNSLLYKDLARNLSPHKRDRYISALKDLGQILGVPEHYRPQVAQGFFEAWIFGDTFSDRLNRHRGLDDEGTMLLVSTEVGWGSDSDNTFQPCPSGSESSLGSTSSEEAESSSEVVEARNSRWDTPSEGFSVDDESSICSGKQAMGNSAVQSRPRLKRRPVLLTPPSTGHAHKRLKTIPRGLGHINFKPFAYDAAPAQTRDVIEREDWPTDDEGTKTPVRSGFFHVQKDHEV